MDQPSKPSDHGFTLIELAVVCALISVMLFFSVPRFEKAHTAGSLREVSQWLTVNIPRLKEQAIREQTDLALQIDAQNGFMWISRAGMTEDQLDTARKEGFRLPEDIRIMDVQFPEEPVISNATAQIRFYAQGFSDRAWIHIADNNRERSFLVETFLRDVEQLEGYQGFEP